MGLPEPLCLCIGTSSLPRSFWTDAEGFPPRPEGPDPTASSWARAWEAKEGGSEQRKQDCSLHSSCAEEELQWKAAPWTLPASSAVFTRISLGSDASHHAKGCLSPIILPSKVAVSAMILPVSSTNLLHPPPTPMRTMGWRRLQGKVRSLGQRRCGLPHSPPQGLGRRSNGCCGGRGDTGLQGVFPGPLVPLRPVCLSCLQDPPPSTSGAQRFPSKANPDERHP